MGTLRVLVFRAMVQVGGGLGFGFRGALNRGALRVLEFMVMLQVGLGFRKRGDGRCAQGCNGYGALRVLEFREMAQVAGC